jgi:hypothetical protein
VPISLQDAEVLLDFPVGVLVCLEWHGGRFHGFPFVVDGQWSWSQFM